MTGSRLSSVARATPAQTLRPKAPRRPKAPGARKHGRSSSATERAHVMCAWLEATFGSGLLDGCGADGGGDGDGGAARVERGGGVVEVAGGRGEGQRVAGMRRAAAAST